MISSSGIRFLCLSAGLLRELLVVGHRPCSTFQGLSKVGLVHVLGAAVDPHVLCRCPAVKRLRSSQLLPIAAIVKARDFCPEAQVLTHAVITVLGIGDSHQRHHADLVERLLVGRHVAAQLGDENSAKLSSVQAFFGSQGFRSI